MSHDLDRSGDIFSYSQSVSTEQLNQCIASFSLVDTQRFFNTSQKLYTFFSARHKPYSRIDYIFASSTLTSLILEVDLSPLSLSDHSSNFLKLSITQRPPRAPRWRFKTNLVKDSFFCDQFRTKLCEFIGINKGSVDDPQILWKAIKGFIRNFSISYASFHQKTHRKNISDLESNFGLQNRQTNIIFLIIQHLKFKLLGNNLIIIQIQK